MRHARCGVVGNLAQAGQALLSDGSTLPPAKWFACSADRKGVHSQTHLAGFSGVLQADPYAGFNPLYEEGHIRKKLTTLSRQADTAKAFNYLMDHWQALCYYASNGWITGRPWMTRSLLS